MQSDEIAFIVIGALMAVGITLQLALPSRRRAHAEKLRAYEAKRQAAAEWERRIAAERKVRFK